MLSTETQPIEQTVVAPQPNSKAIKDHIKRSVASFRTIRMTQMPGSIKNAIDFSQYCIICDKTGQASTYFDYKAHQINFNSEIRKCQANEKTKEESLDSLRNALVYSMEKGDTLVINCDVERPDWRNDWSCETGDLWPAQDIFDFDKWHEEENYLKVVKE